MPVNEKDLPVIGEIIEDQDQCRRMIVENNITHMLDVVKDGKGISSAPIFKPSTGLMLAFPNKIGSPDYTLQAFMFADKEMPQFLALKQIFSLAEWMASHFGTKPTLVPHNSNNN